MAKAGAVLLGAGLLYAMFRVASAAFDDRWWPVRVGAAFGAAGLVQACLWIAGREEHRAWRASLSNWYFFHNVPTQLSPLLPNKLPRPNPPPKKGLMAAYAALGVVPPDVPPNWTGEEGPSVQIHFAIRATDSDGDLLLVVVRGRARGLQHRVHVANGTIEVAPGAAEDVLGAGLAGRIRETCARFPGLLGGTEGDAFLLQVPNLLRTYEPLRANLDVLAGVAREVTRTLVESGPSAVDYAGYRGLVQRTGGGAEPELSAAFERLDKGLQLAAGLGKLPDLDVPARKNRALQSVFGSALVATGILLCLGALRAATSQVLGGRSSTNEKAVIGVITFATLFAVAGVSLQAAIIRRAPFRGDGFTRAQKVFVFLLGAVLAGGFGSCVATMGR